MNAIMKAYCRVFQFVFRAAMPILPYREPEIHGSIEALDKVFEKLKPTGVLLVTDTMLRQNGV